MHRSLSQSITDANLYNSKYFITFLPNKQKLWATLSVIHMVKEKPRRRLRSITPFKKQPAPEVDFLCWEHTTEIIRRGWKHLEMKSWRWELMVYTTAPFLQAQKHPVCCWASFFFFLTKRFLSPFYSLNQCFQKDVTHRDPQVDNKQRQHYFM